MPTGLHSPTPSSGSTWITATGKSTHKGTRPGGEQVQGQSLSCCWSCRPQLSSSARGESPQQTESLMGFCFLSALPSNRKLRPTGRGWSEKVLSSHLKKNVYFFPQYSSLKLPSSSSQSRINQSPSPPSPLPLWSYRSEQGLC